MVTTKAPCTPVPLTIARQGGVESILMEAPEIMVGGDGFRHINQGGRSGFYRVFYTGDASREVLGRLGSMSNLERLGLINDAFAALLSRRLPVDGYLEVVSSYMNERDFIVVDEISSELLSLTLILPFHQGLRDRAREFMRAQLQRLGEKKEGENENDTVLRSSLQQKLVMVDDDYASSLSELFPRYGDIDPDVRGGAVAMAFARSKNSFSPLTLALEQAQSDEDRVNVIRAMGWLQGDELGKFNRLVEEGSVKKQDFYVFYISCSMNPPSGRQFSLRNLEFLHSKMVEYFSGTGYEGTVLEAMIPLIGLEDEGETRKKVEAIRGGQENSMGISKGGLELLAIYSSLRKEVQGG
ncbi:ERAP1-like C-terminal domain-containing protein [Thermogymnomonas acidicola]|uniref:ERAP1-like C-terminal domain-containing protein n=1 Tax=Thermogymnomonas acidicola TaxID=399579 RepID=UPI00094662BB|nr:ERAP1-like C-terminal domain-containing protein [Thermogymnomonas acidicola]